MTIDDALQALNRMVGRWTTRAAHPAFPDLIVHGTVEAEWLEGGRFLIHRSRSEHPDFPDSISIIGATDRDRMGDSAASEPSALTMHYFDSRGVFRVYQVLIEPSALNIWRDAPGFSQRFKGIFADDDSSIAGLWQLSEDGRWQDDLRIDYRRA